MRVNINLTLGVLKGRITFFRDNALMVRCSARMSQVMLYKHKFDLNEAVGDATIDASTVLRDDVLAFSNLFSKEERSLEENEFIESMGDLDFMISVDNSMIGYGIMMHELSHVLFFYDKEFQAAVRRAWAEMSEEYRSMFENHLYVNGYQESEYEDEWFANQFFGFDDVIDPDSRKLFEEKRTMFSEVLDSARRG